MRKITHQNQQFAEILSLIELRKSRAYFAINNEMIWRNWEVGKYVSQKIKAAEWGDKVVEALAKYLKEQMPTLKGFDRRAIYRMVNFYDLYSDIEFVVAMPPLLQLLGNESNTIVSAMPIQTPATSPPIASVLLTQLKNRQKSVIGEEQKIDEEAMISFLAKISWSAHLEIISGCADVYERLFYLFTSFKENWDYRTLRRQIEAGVFERSMIGNNQQSPVFQAVYPEAKNYFKDNYLVEFMELPPNHTEKSLQKCLIAQMKQFILDLGNDFIFIAEDYRLPVGMNDFYLDLLFYHRSLQCLVAIELKTTQFKPEYLGQLDFYLEALDQDVKKANENPSIGILLCKNADSQVVEYALNRSLSPTMIAKYKQEFIAKELLQEHLKFITEKIPNE